MFSRIESGRLNRRGFGAAPGFNGNLALLFSGVLQSVQSDRGLTYGGTTLASNGGGPVGSLSGALATTPVPILFKCTTGGAVGAGAAFSAFYDGGTTPAMTGITPSVGVPVALTGAGTGLLHAWAAGTAVLNDTWKATCAGLADQSGNGKDYSQVVLTRQPVITVGLNGKPGLLFDGSNDDFASALAMPAPGTKNRFLYCGFRVIANSGAAASYFGDTAGFSPWTTTSGAASAASQYAGTVVNTNAITPGTWFRGQLAFTNSAADFSKVGANKVQTGIAGNGAITAAVIGSTTGNGSSCASMELLFATWLDNVPASLAAADAQIVSSYAGLVAV